MADEPMPDTTIGNPSQPSGTTSVGHNKAVSRRWIEVFNERDDRPKRTFVRLSTLPMLPRVWNPNRWTPRHGLGSLRASSTGSRIFVSPWRTRWEKVTWSHSASTSRAPTPGSSKGFHRPKARSHSPALSSTGSSKDGSRSTGSNWTPSRFFDSWAWSSYQVRGCCRASWPIRLRSCARGPDQFFGRRIALHGATSPGPAFGNNP